MKKAIHMTIPFQIMKTTKYNMVISAQYKKKQKYNKNPKNW